jgi:hypothetical protein
MQRVLLFVAWALGLSGRHNGKRQESYLFGAVTTRGFASFVVYANDLDAAFKIAHEEVERVRTSDDEYIVFGLI